MSTRDLSPDEKYVISEIALRLPSPEREVLLRDMQHATANPVSRARILFTIFGYERPPYKGQHPFLVEGKVFDRDGSELSVILHADENGRLLELELVHFEQGEVIEPDWSTLSLY